MSDRPGGFTDPHAVARYAEGPPRSVPGFAGLQRMSGLLLAERVPRDGRVLVVGAGGGLELRAFAESHSGWIFHGVDPSAEMMELAHRTLGPHASRATLQVGTVGEAPPGIFEGATCLLTLHFLDREERARTLAEVHRRLRPGAPFVLAHLSIPGGGSERARWLSRYAAFVEASGVEREQTLRARAAIESQLTVLAPDEDEAALRTAGFVDAAVFYVGFAFRGWIAYA